ncbi:alpha-amylase family glycosyl hydrolase [Spirosoma daeguense]
MKPYIGFFLATLLTVSISYGQSRDTTRRAKEAVSWFKEGVIYQIWLRSFTKEGTLKAAEKRLPQLAYLGATIIYLPPIYLADTISSAAYWSPRQKASPGHEARNPYKSMDYSKIDPEYGTENDLKAFAETAHKLGLRVIMDMVYLHTGPSSNLTRDPKNYHRDASGKPLLNNYNFLRLDFSYPKLREYLINDMIHWVKDCNVDGFRCDVSGSIPVDFWEDARQKLERIKPDIGMLGESNSPAELVRAFDACYGFPWLEELKNVVVNGGSARQLRERWSKQNREFPKGGLFIRYTDNHDQNRTDLVFGEKGSRALNVLNFMLDGIPFLYNGQEIGDGSPFGIFEHWPILWESQGLPQKTELRNWYKDLITLRKTESALQTGETIWLETSKPESVVAFLRKTNTSQLLTIVNVSNRREDVVIQLPEKTSSQFGSRMRKFDARTNHNSNVTTKLPDVSPLTAQDGSVRISLEGFDYYVGKN